MKEFVEKLIEKLNEITEPIRPVGWSRKIEVVETKAVIQIINELQEEYKSNLSESLTSSNNGWIPCSERLPKIFEDTKSSEVVLICGYDKQNDYYWQAMGFYVKAESLKRWFLADCKNTDKPIDWIDIVAWQPLPEPYKITV